MNIRHGLLIVFLSTLMMAVLSGAEQKGSESQPAVTPPRFTADGRVVWGGKGLWQKPLYGQLTFVLDGDAVGMLMEMLNLGKNDIAPVFFMNSKNEIEGNSAIYSAEVRDSTASDVKLGTYSLRMTLLDSGLIEVESLCLLDDPSILANRYSILELPPYLKLAGEHRTPAGVSDIPEGRQTEYAGDQLVEAEFAFFPNSPERSFTITPQAVSRVVVTSNRVAFAPGDSGRMSFLLDLRGRVDVPRGAVAPNGVDLGADGIQLPDYSATRNLLINPSFEAGLRYWAFPTYAGGAMPLRFTNIYELDDAEAHSGEHSLRIRALPIPTTLSLGTFALPFIVGEQYTVSFYVKGTEDQPVRLNVWGRTQTPQLLAGNVESVPVTPDWTRHTISFTPKDRFGSLYFYAQTSGDREDQAVWLDDVQVERGSVTEFVQPPVAAQLVSAERGNFLRFGQAPDFKLHLKTTPNARGTVALAVDDFFFKRVHEAELAFETDGDGEATLTLDGLNEWVTGERARGVLSVSATFTVEGIEQPWNDHFRFSVMDFLDNTAKNKNIFNLTYAYSPQAAGPEMERFVAREQAIGFGSIAYDFVKFANDLDHDLDRERAELVERYGFDLMGRGVLKLHDGVGGEISEYGGKLMMQGIKSRIDPTAEELKEFESIVAAKTGSRPWNQIWWLTGESNPGAMPLESHPDAFAKFLLATLYGAKKGNPDAKVLIEGGPWTLDPELGGKWVERYIQDTRRLDPNAEFDGAAAHHYRNFPENPDTDADIAGFLAMLDRNGCGDWPLYLNEGGNFAPFNIPSEGMSPYIVHSANSWYFGPLSYHFGRAERISAAFSARNWVIGLKYADRVPCVQDFMTPNRYVDIDFTPRPYDKIPNTVHRLLGNATFYEDVRFAPEVRCYVFTDDASGAPIAALWGHKESVDRWKEEPPTFAFDFTGLPVTIIDLMENEVRYPVSETGQTLIPMSPFPVFIRGERGREAELVAAIGDGVSASASDRVVRVTAAPTAQGRVAVEFHNPIMKEFRGEAVVTVGDQKHEIDLRIPPTDRLVKPLPLAQSGDGELVAFEVGYSIDGSPVEQISAPYVFVRAQSGNGRSASDVIDWDALAANAIGEGVSVKTGVARGRLFLMIEAPADGREAEERFAGVGIYVDPFAEVDKWHKPKAAKQGLAVFETRRGASGKMEAVCHYVQGTQVGSGSDILIQGDVQPSIAVRPESDAQMTRMVVEFPGPVLSPARLGPGGRFGLNVTVPTGQGDVVSLAPVRGYRSPLEPGDVDMALVVVGE